MRRIALCMVLGAVACGSGPTSPSGQSERFTWTVNGQAFTASSNGQGALRAGATMSLTGADCSRGPHISIGLSAPSVGVQPVGQA